MTAPFLIWPGKDVCVLPEGNARYMFTHMAGPNGIEWTPIPAKITSIGRVYFHVKINGSTMTRFRLDDFTSADKDDNTRYQIFPSIETCQEYVTRHLDFKELRDILNRAIWNDDRFNHVTTEEIHTFLLRLKNEIPNEKEENKIP